MVVLGGNLSLRKRFRFVQAMLAVDVFRRETLYAVQCDQHAVIQDFVLLHYPVFLRIPNHTLEHWRQRTGIHLVRDVLDLF